MSQAFTDFVAANYLQVLNAYVEANHLGHVPEDSILRSLPNIGNNTEPLPMPMTLLVVAHELAMIAYSEIQRTRIQNKA